MDFSNLTNKLSSVISSVSTTVEKISYALPGNPLAREYEVGEQICSAGIGKEKKSSNFH